MSQLSKLKVNSNVRGMLNNEIFDKKIFQEIQDFQLCPEMTKISCILMLFMVHNFTKCKHLVQNNIKNVYYIIYNII